MFESRASLKYDRSRSRSRSRLIAVKQTPSATTRQTCAINRWIRVRANVFRSVFAIVRFAASSAQERCDERRVKGLRGRRFRNGAKRCVGNKNSEDDRQSAARPSTFRILTLEARKGDDHKGRLFGFFFFPFQPFRNIEMCQNLSIDTPSSRALSGLERP